MDGLGHGWPGGRDGKTTGFDAEDEVLVLLDALSAAPDDTDLPVEAK